MNLVEFFGTKVKPELCRGKYMFAPLDNALIGGGIYALRDKDVNAFVYRKANDVIAIVELVITSHSGYTSRMDEALSHIHELPDWKEKGFTVSEKAPYAPYR